jgi:membrane protein YdbS with pleckstrin-like domain
VDGGKLMKNSKIYEWFGFIVSLISFVSIQLLRHYEKDSSTSMTLLYLILVLGVILTLVGSGANIV